MHPQIRILCLLVLSDLVPIYRSATQCVFSVSTLPAQYIPALSYELFLSPTTWKEPYPRQGKPFLLLEGSGCTKLAPIREGSCKYIQLALISADSGQTMSKDLCPLLIISKRNAMK